MEVSDSFGNSISKMKRFIINNNQIYIDQIVDYLNYNEKLIALFMFKNSFKISKKSLKNNWELKLKCLFKEYDINIDPKLNNYNFDTKEIPNDGTFFDIIQKDQNFFDSIKNKRKYLINKTIAKFAQIHPNGIQYLAAAIGEKWSWSDNDNHWKIILNSKGLFNKKCYHLISVAWIDLEFIIRNIKRGKYKIFLRQTYKNSLVMNGIELKITLQKKQNENENLLYYNMNYFDGDMLDKIIDSGKNKFSDYLICEVNLMDLDNDTENYISVKFSHRNKNNKEGWVIDCIILTPI